MTSENIEGMLNLNPTNSEQDYNMQQFGLRRIETGIWTQKQKKEQMVKDKKLQEFMYSGEQPKEIK